MIEGREEGSIPEYNKSTSNPYDVSFRLWKMKVRLEYLIEWDEIGVDGKLSIINDDSLLHLSQKKLSGIFDIIITSSWRAPSHESF